MVNKKKKHDSLVIPSSPVLFAYLDKPRVHEKFAPNGVYTLDLRVTPEFAAELTNKLRPYAEQIHSEAIANAKPADREKVKKWEIYLPVSQETDKDTGEPTGTYVVKTKQAAKIKGKDDKWINLSVPVYDSDKPAKEVKSPKIGRGSLMRANVQIVPYTNAGGKQYGITLRLIGAQIIKLVEWGGGKDADSLGFNDGEAGDYVSGDDAGGDDPFVGDNDHGADRPAPSFAPSANKNPNF